ncbi:MAG: sulfatase-like hydrolase/transferase [Bacteroidia bacterium]|nr:sulfatase-like hydrolase/transferase [Bacteroidia bacterium]
MIKRLTKFLPTYIITIVKLFLLEFLILSICRVIFYFGFKTIDVGSIDGIVILKAFRMGFEFDMVASTYAMLLPTLLLFLNELFYQKTMVFHKLAFVITTVIFWLYAFISASDFPYYLQFGSHLNKQAFLWAASPAFVLKLIFGSFSYYGYLFLFLAFAYVIYKVVKRIFSAAALQLKEKSGISLKTGLSFLLLIPFLIIGARGRLSSKSTTHEGLAIVSDNLFVNQVALNPNFTMFRSLLFQKVKNYKIPNDIDLSIAYARNYFGIKGPYSRSIARKQLADTAFRPFNVVIVCMESMSSYKTGIQGRENLTPNFNSLIKESLYFDNFFSSGIHTFNGLFSTCSGYPCMLTEHALRRYTKKPFTTLGNLLQKKNYQTFFYSTHDPHFDNMEGFFTQNGYTNTFSAFDLPKEKTISVTGVADHEIYNLFFSTINSADKSKPFLGFIMTGSDHGPWVIPNDIPFKPDANTEEKRSTQYADWAIGEFMKNAKKQWWYNNTLFVFLGDHGYSISGTYEMPLSYHHIPFVLHKPNTLKAETLNNAGYQPDVISTVAGILNLEFENTGFGINLRKEKHPFVFFTADDKIGCVDSTGNYFYELITQKTKRLRRYKNLDQQDYYLNKKTKADSLEIGAKHMLNTAEYFIRQDYFTY